MPAAVCMFLQYCPPLCVSLGEPAYDSVCSSPPGKPAAVCAPQYCPSLSVSLAEPAYRTASICPPGMPKWPACAQYCPPLSVCVPCVHWHIGVLLCARRCEACQQTPRPACATLGMDMYICMSLCPRMCQLFEGGMGDGSARPVPLGRCHDTAGQGLIHAPVDAVLGQPTMHQPATCCRAYPHSCDPPTCHPMGESSPPPIL
jgi:hypothetical protein